MFDLTNFTTLKLPFRARSVLKLSSKENVVSSMPEIICDERLILSGGSNWIALKPEFDGVVIRPELKDWNVVIQGEKVLLEVGAGHVWHHVVMNTLDQGWYGLENLALIPGWVGAAPVQNIGAYGVELKDHCKAVTVYDFEAAKILTLDVSEMQFGYRYSLLKDYPNRFLVVTVTFELSTKPMPRIDYGEIRERIERAGGDFNSPHDIAHAVITIRQSKLPDPEQIPNVGSFFKNPVVRNAVAERLLDKFPTMPAYSYGGETKLAAGWMIDHLGLKGMREGGFMVHGDQALVLVNQGKGTVEDLRRLVSFIRVKSRETFGISLQVEPTQIGRPYLT